VKDTHFFKQQKKREKVGKVLKQARGEGGEKEKF